MGSALVLLALIASPIFVPGHGQTHTNYHPRSQKSRLLLPLSPFSSSQSQCCSWVWKYSALCIIFATEIGIFDSYLRRVFVLRISIVRIGFAGVLKRACGGQSVILRWFVWQSLIAVMSAHTALGVALAATTMPSSNSVSLAGFENCRPRFGNTRATADTAERTGGGTVDPGKWRENQGVSIGTLSLGQCHAPRLQQTGGTPSASLREREVVVGMKEIEKRLELLLAVQTKLEDSVPPPSKQRQESPEQDNFHVNCGSAIRSLRDELPALFYKDLNYGIYREDITFSDPMNTFAGIENYKTLFWALRFHGRIFFKALWVDIVRVYQPSDKTIMVRWIVRGIPRVPWEAQGRFEGTSEYKLDKDGKIYSHKVDNVIMNGPPKYQTRSVMDLVRAAAAHGTPTPTYFQKVGLFFFLATPYLHQFSWVRFYFALRSTLAVTAANPRHPVPSVSLNP